MDKNTTRKPMTIPLEECVYHLEKQLGFEFGYDFTRWNGPIENFAYIRMRCVFRADDIIDNDSDKLPLSKSSEGGSITFKHDVMDILKKYMYDFSHDDIDSKSEESSRLLSLGLFGERLYELYKHQELAYDETREVCTICLAPEKILADMYKTEIRIVGVKGYTTENLCFLVNII